MVRHISTVAVLMIVQGVLEALMALVALLYGSLYGAMATIPLFSDEFSHDPGAPPPEVFSALFGGMGLLFMALAFAMLMAGALKIFAGAYNLRYRKRNWGLVALASSFASALACYCAPTGIALAIFGLIVYTSEPVQKAFAMGEAGKSPREVLHAMHAPA